MTRAARSSHAAELQEAGGTKRQLIYVHLSLWEIIGVGAPLKNWQKVVAQARATLILESRGVHDAFGTQRKLVLSTEREEVRSKSKGVQSFVARDKLWKH